MLLAVTMSATSYAQAGGVIGGEGSGEGAVTIQLATSDASFHCDIIDIGDTQLMSGTYSMMGTAQGVTTLHAQLPADSPFGFFDESTANAMAMHMDSLNMRATQISQQLEMLSMRMMMLEDSIQMMRMMGDSISMVMMDSMQMRYYEMQTLYNSTFASMDSVRYDLTTYELPKTLDISVDQSVPSFSLPIMYYGQAGTSSCVLIVSGNGARAVANLTATMNQVIDNPGSDSVIVGEPFLSVSTTQLTLTGANPETWTLAWGNLAISAENIDVLQLQMQSGWNIQMGGDDGYFVTSKSYNLNYAATTLNEHILLNTVSPGQYSDVLIISAPGTNLQPIMVNISAVVEAQQSNDSAAYVAFDGFPNPFTMHLNQGDDMTISLPITCRNIDSLTVYVAEPFATVDHQIPGFGNAFARFYGNEISEGGFIYLNVQVNTAQAGQFDGRIYAYANEGYPDYTLYTSITIVGDSTQQSTDTTQQAYLYTTPERLVIDGYQSEYSPVGSELLKISSSGVQQWTASFVDGTHFTIFDALHSSDGAGGEGGEGNYIVMNGEKYYTTNSFTMPIYNGMATEMSLAIFLYTSQLGDFVDTLVITADNIAPVRVVVEGHVTGSGYVVPDTVAAIDFDNHYMEFKVIGAEGVPTVQPITGMAIGVSEIHARVANGRNFSLQQVDQSGSLVYVQEISIPLDSSMVNAYGVTQFVMNVMFAPDSLGMFFDTLTVWTDNQSVAPERIILYGEASEPYVEPGYFSFSDDIYRDFTFNLSNAGNYYMQRQYIRYNNVDSIVMDMANGTFFKLCSSDNNYTFVNHLVYAGTYDWMRSNYAGIKFLGTEVGEYWDTITFTPYGVGLAPQQVYLHATIINDMLPSLDIDQTELSFSIDKGAYWSNCYKNFYMYPNHVDTIRMHLVDGSHFKLLDYYATGGRTFDSTMLVTNLELYSSWFYSQWDFRPFLLSNEAGVFVDTLVIEAVGVEEAHKLILRGSVMDWYGGLITWQDKDVLISLQSDSLIVSGSGSTSDYTSSYNPRTYSESSTAQWITDIMSHRTYENYPKHLKVEPGVSRLGNYAFYAPNFRFLSVDLGQLDSLGDDVFRENYANNMDVLELPATLRYIGCGSVENLKAQRYISNLPADVEVCGNPVGSSSPTVVVANTQYLLQIPYPNNTLVMPATDSIRDIYVAYGYVYEAHETGYDIVANTYMTLDPSEIAQLPDNPSMILDYSMFDTTYCAHVSLPIDASLDMSRFVKKDFIGNVSPFFAFEQWVQENYYDFRPSYSGVNTTLINEGFMTADTVELREKMFSNLWTFMGLPFNQKMSELGVPEGTYTSFRRFDALKQAAGDYNNVWVEVENDDTLHAGEPFIVQLTNLKQVPAELTFRAMDDAMKQGIFTPSVRSLALQQYPAEQTWNANWNFLTNPYPCFYDTRAIGTNGIITVYSSHAGRMEYYRSFSLQDDYYVLQPHEAFFYQAAAGETALRLPLEGKQHSARAAGIEYVDPWAQWEEWGEDIPSAAARDRRILLNFIFEQNGSQDQARVVLNEAASMDYEVGVDALKMFAQGSNAAQFYAEQGGVKQSILERPTASGMVYMGVRLATAGECTISIPETNGLTINLFDTQTAVMTNLSQGNYTFYGTPGEYNGRFIIGLVGGATALEDFISALTNDGVKKVIENGHVFILRGSDKFDVLGNKH